MTAGQSINYDALTQDALRGVVRMVLTQVAEAGLPGDHHFYVAFDTQAPSVVLSRRLKEKYPDEMMIVLQHRFWDLIVTDERFEVKLTFDGIPERLVVPYSAIRVFYDPSVRFTLQFGDAAQQDEPQDGTGPRRRRDGSGLEPVGQRIGPRSIGDRRTRSRTKAREDGESGDPARAAPRENAPTVFVPRSADPKPLPAPTTASAGEAADGEKAGIEQVNGEETPAKDAAPGGGAKVFSLDQFRNKK